MLLVFLVVDAVTMVTWLVIAPPISRLQEKSVEVRAKRYIYRKENIITIIENTHSL